MRTENVGEPIFIWANSPRRGPIEASAVTCQFHLYWGVACKSPLFIYKAKNMRARGLLLLTLIGKP
jgi:hypothetical protein